MSPRKSASPAGEPVPAPDAATAIGWLKELATPETLAGMTRYGLPSERAFGVAVRDIQVVAKRAGRSHGLALELWESGWFEARMLAAYVDDPALVTAEQMDGWCESFDNWGVCDTVCFVLFDKAASAWSRLEPWARRDAEFVKRGAFALLWALALHDKKAADERFLEGLRLVEREAEDDRNFVRKAVAMALRAVGKRNPALRGAAAGVAERLAASASAAARRTGKDALRELAGGG